MAAVGITLGLLALLASSVVVAYDLGRRRRRRRDLRVDAWWPEFEAAFWHHVRFGRPAERRHSGDR